MKTWALGASPRLALGASRCTGASRCAPSMWPRFCKRGNRPRGSNTGMPAWQLQWGHAFVSMETTLTSRAPPVANALQWGHAFVSVETVSQHQVWATLRQASMGPRFCKRGNCRANRRCAGTDNASMGPRFCKRGNTTVFGADAIRAALQWGHAFVSVETTT